MIAFECLQCGYRMKAPDEAAGKRGPCKKCGNTVTVPGPPGRAVATIEKPAAELIESPPELPTSIIDVTPSRSSMIRFTNDEQDPGVVQKNLAKVEDLLTSGEELCYIGVQQKPVANIAPDAVVLMSKRFLWFNAKLLGRYDFVDYPWRELVDARIQEGMLGATISVQTTRGHRLSVDYLPKKQAREIYHFAQEKEELALEERRQRHLEEKRAGAGGTTVAVNSAPLPTAAAASDPVAKLTQLKQMLDAGLITQAEYDATKANSLAAM